jgi:hypothetical protein
MNLRASCRDSPSVVFQHWARKVVGHAGALKRDGASHMLGKTQLG